MIGRPDSHISLIPTNRGQNFKFSAGPRTQITVDNEGKIQPGGEQEILDADGSPIRQRIEEKHVEDFFAKRISQRRQNAKPWITNDILKLIRAKDKTYHQLIKESNATKKESVMIKYKEQNNEITKQIRRSKKFYYNQYFTKNS